MADQSASLTVVIPSRAQDTQFQFLERATQSIRKQTVIANFDVRILVALDRDVQLPASFCSQIGIEPIASDGTGQARALNGAMRSLGDTDYVAFLEDDDQWAPQYLDFAARSMQHGDFVSSTQAEFDERGVFLRVNDFPTPSGWFMRQEVLGKVGVFDESYRFHLDNEWLGRLREAGVRRVHLVEATAPVEMVHAHQVRPWLAQVLTAARGLCILARHPNPFPLVNRLIHSGSGMARISTDPALLELSQAEHARLVHRYGSVPL